MLLKDISLLLSFISAAENMALTFTCNVRSNTSTILDVEHFSTLVVYDFGVSGQFGSKNHTQKTDKIYQDF